MDPAIPYTIRRSPRARRVRVNVHAHTGVEVVLPVGASEHAAAAALVELGPWIERRVAELSRVRAQIAARDGTLPYLGRTLQLCPQHGRLRVHLQGERLLVPAGTNAGEGTGAGEGEGAGAGEGGSGGGGGGGGEEARVALERWYRRRARLEVAARLDRACALAGTPYRDLVIRGQRTRWASCSPQGRMSFNWRLLLAPEAVLDYVVWHEVCHLQILDHSPRFWKLVERWWPRYRDDREWLRRFGATLVL